MRRKNAEIDAMKGKYISVLCFHCLCGRFGARKDASELNVKLAS